MNENIKELLSTEIQKERRLHDFCEAGFVSHNNLGNFHLKKVRLSDRQERKCEVKKNQIVSQHTSSKVEFYELVAHVGRARRGL